MGKVQNSSKELSKILRRKKLLELLSKIESGELKEPAKTNPRQTKEYISPKDRSTYNYGYEENHRSVFDLGYIKDKD